MSAAMLEITVVIVMSEDYSYDVQENVDSAALACSGFDMTCTDSAGRTILHIACQRSADVRHGYEREIVRRIDPL